MNESNWILIDTETTGFHAPIFVVELAAQRMLGWKAIGPPFRRLLNQNAEISAEVSRVHGYTREILERDGDPALDVYRDFALYVDGLPITAYNLSYDWDRVLMPEWARLGIKPIGTSGFCALRLAQRLLDPVPAGNCKLQTLRQYYRLPERGAHTALGDVETVADLMATVLRPLAEHRGLQSWADLHAYTHAEWFPSRIAFGKHKGRNIHEARRDQDLYGWLEWLSGFTNERSARMGRWYVTQLESSGSLSDADLSVFARPAVDTEINASNISEAAGTSILLYINPAAEQLRQLIAAARSRLTELEAQYTQDHHAVDVVRAALFGLLKKHYQARDRLQLIVDYRRKFVSTLLQSGEDYADKVSDEYGDAKAKSDADYEQLETTTVKQKALSQNDALELRDLWKKLVRLYHPDRFTNEPDKLEAYHQLTSAINQARDNSDLQTLREIANDPHGFMQRKGWASLDFNDLSELSDLHRMYELLQLKIIATLESLNELHESPDFELQRLRALQPDFLDDIAKLQAAEIDAEAERLTTEAAKLEVEIAELTGTADQTIT
jgi:DNA polymerase-3 subunit epsilon